MGRVFDFLTGGNIKIAVNDLVNIHHQLDGDYSAVYNGTIMSCLRYIANTEPMKAENLISKLQNNQLCNYVDLVVFVLNVSAAPAGVYFEETKRDFSNKIIKYLNEKNIPNQYILGDNSQLTKKSFSDLLDT